MTQKIFTIILFLSFQSLYGQNEFEALKLNQLNYGYTARGAALGGALGSIGGDFGSVSLNPAALGRYSKSEFLFTPNISYTTNSASYLTGINNLSKTTFGFNNINLVFANRKTYEINGKRKNKNIKSIAFGIGMNRIAHFGENMTYSGNNFQNSINDFYAGQINANGGITNISTAPLNAQYAFDLLIVDKDGSTNNVKSFVPKSIKQTKSIKAQGSIYEVPLALGLNYKDKILFGASLNFNVLDIKRETSFSEIDISGNNNNDFSNFGFYENLTSSGIGINGKLGIIAVPVRPLRIGLAYHSPTSYSIDETYYVKMNSNVENLIANPDLSKDYTGENDYTITIPGKFLGSASYFFKNYGFITADLEKISYQNIRYKSQGFEEVNQSINSIFRSNYNFRIGGEGRVNQYSYRLGYAYNGNPLVNNFAVYSKRNTYSAGLGYRVPKYFVDLTYALSKNNYSEYPYIYNGINLNPASIKKNQHSVLLTIGYILNRGEY